MVNISLMPDVSRLATSDHYLN